MANTRNSNPPADLLTQISNCLDQYIRRGDRLAVALSGGVDSVLLLNVLLNLSASRRFSLSAVHVNHSISPNSDRWQSFCERLCETLNVRLDVHRVIVEPGDEGIEAAARRLRYIAFAETRAEWLVLAHHRDDQVETLLFNLLRGSGIRGAAAMPTSRTIPGCPELGILRPLLGVSRNEIRAYAESEGLNWIEDESNADIRYSRNFLRHRVLPVIRERFPACDSVLARAASLFAEGENLIQELARNDAATAMHEGRIQTTRLKGMDEARARNLMRYVLQCEGIALPDSVRLHEIVRQVCHAAPGRQLRFELGNKVLYRYRNEVWVVPRGVTGQEVEWHGEDIMKWGGGMIQFRTVSGEGVSLTKLTGGCIRVAPRKGAERFRPDIKRPHRELRKILQELDVPPWERDRIPMLWCDENLVWVHGVGIDSAWKCTSGEDGLVPEYRPCSLTS